MKPARMQLAHASRMPKRARTTLAAMAGTELTAWPSEGDNVSWAGRKIWTSKVGRACLPGWRQVV